MSVIRTRWAAIGAAVAVTLGAGGIGFVSATNPDDAVAFVPITPCRVMDTRAEFNVGPKTTPIGPGEIHTVNTTTGDTGNCSGIPTTATGVSLNITALDATLPTFLTVWATGDAQPEASSLNPVPGQPPTPNAVTTGIDTNGRFDIYNLQGNVEAIADITGYYTDHSHDDRYYTKSQTDTKVDLTKFLSINVYADPELGLNQRWADLGDAGVGGINTAVDFNFTVPPDFPPGSPVEIRVLAYARDETAFPCNGRLNENWLFAMRAGTGRLPAGSPRLSPSPNAHIFAESDIPHEFVFTTSPTLQLQPGDSVGFGLFSSAPETQCSLVISGVGVHYS